MTKMLVNFDANTFKEAFALDCDIIGIDYCNNHFNILNEHSIHKPLGCSTMLSLAISEFDKDFLTKGKETQEILSFYDFIKLEIPFLAYRENYSDIATLARKKSIILTVRNYEKLSDLLTLLPLIAASGIYGVMLAPNQKKDKLTKQFSIADISIFIEQAHKNRLAACLMGYLEAPDVARLLPFSPDILSFDVSQFFINGMYNTQKGELMHSLIQGTKEDLDDNTCKGFGTDRILINNFILPIAIGAYNHERNRLQKVRFSVIADVLRLSLNPEDMRHIFSYDLIIDGIRRLALLEHIDLVETLAERIAAFILDYQLVQKVIVRVEKLELEPESVGIEIERVKKTL